MTKLKYCLIISAGLLYIFAGFTLDVFVAVGSCAAALGAIFFVLDDIYNEIKKINKKK